MCSVLCSGPYVRATNKMLWIGHYASEDMFMEMAKKGYSDAAAYVSQRNIIDALDAIGIRMDTLNAYRLPVKYADFKVERKSWTRKNGSENVSISFKNVRYIAHVLRAMALRREAEQWAIKNRAYKLVVLVYGMQSSSLSAALRIKQLTQDVHICLIIPDLPQYMDFDMSAIKKILKGLDWQVLKRQFNSIDSFVLYAEPMAQFLGIPDYKWMLMEGSLSAEEIPPEPHPYFRNKTTIVMYSGQIDKRYGIIEMLQAIELIKDDKYEFWFTGKGNAMHELSEAIKRDPRIKYLGFLPSREDLLQKQQQASMLINLRLPNEPGSTYAFPSKLLEYMASGRPVLTPKIGGIPEEYYKYLIIISSVLPSDIANAIQRTAAMSEEQYRQVGKFARRFIVENKTSHIQAQRIISFLSGKL